MDEHALSSGESNLLREANWLLTLLTETHSQACECELCQARMLTDVQDESAFTVRCLLED